MSNINNQKQRLPRIAGQQADVAVGSPLAVLAVFTELIRARFRVDNALSWVWDPNATPASTETNDPDAPRKLIIEAAFNESTEIRNYRPAIFVDRGEISPGKVSIGNFAGQELKTGRRGFFAMATVPIDIEVVSERKGESATLADITWFFLLASQEQINATFGFHSITPPVLGRTAPFEQDKGVWSTHVAFEVQYPLRWSTVPVSPLLADIKTRFKISGGSNFDAFILEQYNVT